MHTSSSCYNVVSSRNADLIADLLAFWGVLKSKGHMEPHDRAAKERPGWCRPDTAPETEWTAVPAVLLYCM